MIPVVYTPIAEKYKNLKKLYKDAITNIRVNPLIGDAKTGDLKGIYSLDIRYNRTNYELTYRISHLDNGDILVVIMAGTRKNFYKELKRYMK